MIKSTSSTKIYVLNIDPVSFNLRWLGAAGVAADFTSGALELHPLTVLLKRAPYKKTNIVSSYK